MRKTKIIATIGPASSSKEVLKQMMDEGVTVCRLNFSHGAHADHLKVIERIKEINEEFGYTTSILADLQGPKLRVGEMKEGTVVKDGQEFVFTNEECVGDETKAYMTYEQFPQDVQPGERVLLNDGKLIFEVVSTNRKDTVVVKVIHGGELSSKKGVNLPNTKISQPCLTEKDLEDLEFALSQNVDWIGLSFVRSARDIIELRHLIANKKKNARIIAKIEKPEAVEDIKDIIIETDAVMVARGDLGVEIPMQEVPLIQKKIVKDCLKYSKPVVIATQMMETMIENITPTRAEVNDVANAVLDGADAVMLSGETSVGKYPVDVIKSMAKIIDAVGPHSVGHNVDDEEPEMDKDDDRFITDSICFNASRLADKIKAKAIVTMTHSGYTAFKISSRRSKADIFVFTGNRDLITILNLVWGVKAFYYDKMVSTDHTIADIKYFLKKKGYLEDGDMIINTASIPLEDKGKTNMLKLSCV